jgi:hypothetical protein
MTGKILYKQAILFPVNGSAGTALALLFKDKQSI